MHYISVIRPFIIIQAQAGGQRSRGLIQSQSRWHQCYDNGRTRDALNYSACSSNNRSRGHGRAHETLW